MRVPRLRRELIVAVTLVLAGRASLAQCPDGSAPPCRSAQATLSRQANPPLDERTWIVVPFDNLASSADVDWLRRASVNMLYMSLSQWKDVRVIDDERVGELLREVPEAAGRGPLPQTAGVRVARRAGAGRLVMGDFLKTGSRTTITAKLIDVRTGARIRSVSEAALTADSIMPVYGRLARQMLNLPASESTSPATFGTTRLDAYQEYVAGTQAFRRYDLVGARRNLERALELDSLFALAHYKLGQVLSWQNPDDSVAVRGRAAAAQRLGRDLPPRERSLIKAFVAANQRQQAEACDIYAEMLRADSLDVDALFGLGLCSSSENTLEYVPGGDTTVLYFRTSLNTSIRAMKKVLELDPTAHIAFERIVQVLSLEQRSGYRKQPGTGARVPQSRMVAIVRRSGDSLLTVPAPDSVLQIHRAEAVRANTRRTNLEMARRIAVSWTELAPNEARAHAKLGALLLDMGRFDEARRELERKDVMALRDVRSVRSVSGNRSELAIRQWRWADARRLVDTMLLSDDVSLRELTGVILAPAFGKLRTLDSLLAESDARMRVPAMMRGRRRQVPRVTLGITTDSAVIAEARFALMLDMNKSPASPPLASFETFAFGLRLPRKDWPSVETGRANDARTNLVVALARGDTAAVRENAQRLDSVTKALSRAELPDSGSAIVAADAYLILKDSAAALRSLRRFLDSTVAFTPFQTPVMDVDRTETVVEFPSRVGWLWPRAMLLRADLALALDHKAEAKVWYQRFVEAWANADPEFQPIVERARRALQTIGGG